MPTPYGSRGGMAFSAEELSVLRSALAVAGHFQPAAREYAELGAAVEETVGEWGRFRSFLLADLARYRDALPGAAMGYLEVLREALDTGYLPRPDDLTALRGLGEAAVTEAEASRRAALLRRCERLAEGAVRSRFPVLPAARTATGREPRGRGSGSGDGSGADADPPAPDPAPPDPGPASAGALPSGSGAPPPPEGMQSA